MANLRAVLVPGIMGSALKDSSGGDIWSESHLHNIRLLSSNSSTIKWGGQRARASLIKAIRVSDVVPWMKASILGKLISYLSKHADFGRPGGTIDCPYDWRASLIQTAPIFCKEIQEKLGQNSPLDAQLVNGEAKLVVFSLSMGGLLVRVAIGKGLIHPTRIERIIHIGTPLRGAPAAFRTAFDKSSLPLMQEWFSLTHLFSVPVVKVALLECFRSFPSLYELLPPADVRYMRYSQLVRENPLQQTFLNHMRANGARAVHASCSAAATILSAHNIPVHTIYSDTTQTELEYDVEAVAQPSPGYRILSCAIRGHGDGTVPVYSAEGDSSCDRRPVSGVKHAFLCNSGKVVEILPTMLGIGTTA